MFEGVEGQGWSWMEGLRDSFRCLGFGSLVSIYKDILWQKINLILYIVMIYFMINVKPVSQLTESTKSASVLHAR